MEKKGLSSVVSTLLLILLTITAVSVAASFIVPFVRNNLEDTSCFEFRDYFKFDDSLGYNCYRENSPGTNIYQTSIRAKNDASAAENVKGFAIRYVNDAGVQKFDIIDGAPITPPVNIEILGVTTGNIIIPKPSTVGVKDTYPSLTYTYQSTEVYEDVEIYPILKSDDLCERSDSIKIKKC